MTLSGKIDQVPQKFEIELLISAGYSFFDESIGAKSAAIRASVTELWRHAFQQPGNINFEKTRFEVLKSIFPYTNAISVYVQTHVTINHTHALHVFLLLMS